MVTRGNNAEYLNDSGSENSKSARHGCQFHFPGSAQSPKHPLDLNSEDLARIAERLSAINWDQKKLLKNIRGLRAKEARREEKERRLAAMRRQHARLKKALAGIAAAVTAWVFSNELAHLVIEHFQPGNTDLENLLNYEIRLLGSLVYLLPTCHFVLKAAFSNEKKLAILILVAGFCIHFSTVLGQHLVSRLADCFGFEAGLITPVVLFYSFKREYPEYRQAP